MNNTFFLERFAGVLILLCIALLTLAGFMVVDLTSDKSLANVNQVQGVYLFVQCKPVNEYTFQGNIKSGLTMSGKPDELFNNVVKQAKKKFPDCDAIIFTDATLEKADCIKFKSE